MTMSVVVPSPTELAAKLQSLSDRLDAVEQTGGGGGDDGAVNIALTALGNRITKLELRAGALWYTGLPNPEEGSEGDFAFSEETSLIYIKNAEGWAPRGGFYFWQEQAPEQEPE